MDIAYLISAHTDAPQLARLIKALHPDADFFIHIDLKSDIKQFTDIINAPNVHFLENRLDVRWGTLIEVEYQMALIKAAVEYPRHFDRIFFLSGMDYPLWSNAKITKWLEEQGDREILQGINMDTPFITQRQRDQYQHARPLFRRFSNKWNQKLSIICRKALVVLGRRKPLHFAVDGQTWHLYKGSAWWCISQELAAYVLHSYETKSVIADYFEDSFGQAETLIQTIAFNSPEWAGKCILNVGEYTTLAALTPLHFIIYEPVIKVMDINDLDILIGSGRMFARKLRSGVSDSLVEALEEQRGVNAKC